MKERPAYGGQAVIEGVMVRGQRHVSLAVRRPTGDIYTHCEPLHGLYTAPLRRVPLVRGVIVLAETLVLGARALNRSAAIAAQGDAADPQELPRWVFLLTLGVSLALGIALFMVAPLVLASVLERAIPSGLVVNLIEGVIRLGILVGYIGAIGLMPDIRRVFAYHGAEHMAVHAHEHGDPLDVAHVRRYPTAHPRCGTAFLLVVVVVSVLLFALLGRPAMVWLVLSRILLVPAIAAISYEFIRFSGVHRTNPLVRAISAPSLWLQGLTTRQPDDGQVEVAIRALEVAVAADGGRAPAEGPQVAQPGAPEGGAPPSLPRAPGEGPIPRQHLPSTDGHQDATR